MRRANIFYLLVVFTMACSSDDSSSDSDAGRQVDGGGGEGPWSWCPSQSSFVGDSAWSDRISVSGDLFCTSANERESLSDVMAHKMRVSFVPGSYKLPPPQDGEGDFKLPLCTETKDGTEGPKADGESTYKTEIEGGVQVILRTTTSLEAGGQLFIEGAASTDAQAPEGSRWSDFRIDKDNSGPSHFVFGLLSVAIQPTSSEESRRILAPCGLDAGRAAERNFTFDNGDTISFSFNAIAGSVFTGPSGAHRVTGMVDGQAIDISNFYQILYSPGHHHAGGEQAVFFDAPIRDACGIKASAIDGGTPTAALINCDLSEIASLTVTDFNTGQE